MSTSQFLSVMCEDVLVKGSTPLTREGALEPAIVVLPTQRADHESVYPMGHFELKLAHCKAGLTFPTP